MKYGLAATFFFILQMVFGISLTAGAQQAGTPEAKPSAPQVRKVLFLGNSITLHGPSKAVDWSGNWGMAASAEEKDFVHIVTRSLANTAGAEPKVMVRNIADFERKYATYDVGTSLKDALEFHADLVVVAIGENVANLDSDDAKAKFADSVGKLLRALKTDPVPTIVVRSCFWPNHAKDEILKRACQDLGGVFVDISGLAGDESNYARSERKFSHDGVAAHPGDKGMQAIAKAILDAVNGRPKERPAKQELKVQGRE